MKHRGSKRNVEGMARYGIRATNALGVSVGDIRQLGKQIGRNHDLALALWHTGIYEARMLTAFVADPKVVTPAQMDAWCRDFDNWAICDTLCFHLFDKTPHAWKKVEQWSGKRAEFVKRASFALIASIAGHDKKAPDQPFLDSFALIERGADDERNFVKKGVSWALRGIGHRNPALHSASLVVARRLAASKDAASRWVGKDALRDLTRDVVTRKLATRKKARETNA